MTTTEKIAAFGVVAAVVGVTVYALCRKPTYIPATARGNQNSTGTRPRHQTSPSIPSTNPPTASGGPAPIAAPIHLTLPVVSVPPNPPVSNPVPVQPPAPIIPVAIKPASPPIVAYPMGSVIPQAG